MGWGAPGLGDDLGWGGEATRDAQGCGGRGGPTPLGLLERDINVNHYILYPFINQNEHIYSYTNGLRLVPPLGKLLKE